MASVSSTSRALKVGITSATASQVELSEQVRLILRPRLLAIPGVANVAIWGAREREYHVELDPARLEANRITVDEVLRSVGAATRLLPGGYVDGPTQRLALSHVAPVRTVVDLEQLPIAADTAR